MEGPTRRADRLVVEVVLAAPSVGACRWGDLPFAKLVEREEAQWEETGERRGGQADRRG
jgi:hypothetical protein